MARSWMMEEYEEEEALALQERICSKVRMIWNVELLKRIDGMVKSVFRRGSR